jgi:zinc protease
MPSPKEMLLNRPILTAALLLLFTLAACSESTAPAEDAASTNNSAQTNGYTLIERVAPGSSEIVIPYSKYELDNGLTVIIHEDMSDPLVHVDVTYHVGSAREEARRSGFAHFFEHMMFQGSEHVADEQHIGIVTESGGTMNGTTSFDRTNYFETVPSNQLETMLWLESDRMGYFLDAVTQEKFEVQRDTVKNERGQSYENSPYGLWSEKSYSAIFPAGHPYSWMPIGFIEDLDAATLDDLKSFFLRWYGPNNATLTIGGYVDVTEVMEQVVKYFGEIPRGPDVENAEKQPAVLDDDRYISYVDRNIRFPGLFISYPTVPQDHPDRVALEGMNEIITVGRKSFFYKEFILTQKAIQASGFNSPQELAGLITFLVLPFPGTPLAEFETEMRAILDSFDAESISDDDIQIYKATREAGLINSLASVSGKVRNLAANETYLNDPNMIQKDLDDIRALTREDILRVYNTYIKDKPAVYLSVVPEGGEDIIAQADNFEIPVRPPSIASSTASLEERDAPESFDRFVRPTPPPNPLVTMPDYWRQNLDNGIEVIGTSSTEVPLVSIRMVFEGGHLLESPDKYGVASLAGQMMNEDTERFTAEEFENELDKLGSNISVGAGGQSFSVSMSTLERNLDATLELLEERLYNSRFMEDDLERLRQQQIESIEASKEEPSGIAAAVYPKLIYGEDHAMSVSSGGTIETLQSITLEDVEAFARQNLVSQALKISVVGDLTQEEVIAKLDFLQNLPNEGVALNEQPEGSNISETTLYLVDKPGASQSEIRIGYLSDVTYDAFGEYWERSLMNYILGGAFNSRINLNLREDKGYTYGARSGFSASKLPGPFTASASVRTDSTQDSVVQFINEITSYRESGITPEELQFTKDAIGQSEARDYETPGQKARLLSQIINYDLESDFVRRQQDVISNLSAERVLELAQQHLPLEQMKILVVGDKAVIGESLVELGYPIIEMDEEGNPLN